MSYYTKTKNLCKKIKFNRSGLIFYTVENKDIYFIFGVDNNHGEMTDMGGSIEIGENYIQAAIREAYEESLGLLDYREKEEYVYQKSLSVYNYNTIILFLQIEVNKETLMFNYKKRHLEKIFNDEFSENSSLIYINSKDLKKIIEIEKKYRNDLFYFDFHNSNMSNINDSDIILPLLISDILSCLYNYKITSYPVMYNKIRKILKPVYNNIMYDFNKKIII